MIGRICVTAIFIFIGACASSGPETAEPAVTASPSSVDAEASGQSTAAPEGEIYDLDAPAVETTASALPEDDPDEIVCRKEKQTGSSIVRKVCRTRAEMDATEAEAQESMRRMRSIHTGSACAMEGSC